MSNLKEIADNIINKNFDHALELCEKYQNEKNKYIILNFKGAIYLSQNKMQQSLLQRMQILRCLELFVGLHRL